MSKGWGRCQAQGPQRVGDWKERSQREWQEAEREGGVHYNINKKREAEEKRERDHKEEELEGGERACALIVAVFSFFRS